jgi:hypothetical protein
MLKLALNVPVSPVIRGRRVELVIEGLLPRAIELKRRTVFPHLPG